MNRLKNFDCGAVWEDLRRQACQLENEIDHKLVSYSKLGTNYSNYTALGSSDSATPKVGTSNLVNNMSADIQQLLTSLSKINEQMSDFLNSDGKRFQTPMVLHTLQRHYDILQDYYHEYEKTKSNITAFQEREDLLGSISSYRNSGGGSHSELYLKEHEHLLRSEQLVDDQISLAMATKDNLQSQKGMLYGVTDKMNSFTSRFPVINSLIQRINFRKRRDTIVIALVISSCVILLIVYKLVW